MCVSFQLLMACNIPTSSKPLNIASFKLVGLTRRVQKYSFTCTENKSSKKCRHHIQTGDVIGKGEGIAK